MADAYIAQLAQAKVFPAPIVTTTEPGKTFYQAEAYHQNYLTLHPYEPYIAINDLPKVEALKQLFPNLYRKVAGVGGGTDEVTAFEGLGWCTPAPDDRWRADGAFAIVGLRFPRKDPNMPSLDHHGAHIHYEEFGRGFPILTFAPAGLRSVIDVWSQPSAPINPTTEFADKHRVIAMDQRNAGGQSRAPISAQCSGGARAPPLPCRCPSRRAGARSRRSRRTRPTALYTSCMVGWRPTSAPISQILLESGAERRHLLGEPARSRARARRGAAPRPGRRAWPGSRRRLAWLAWMAVSMVPCAVMMTTWASARCSRICLSSE